MAIGEVKTVDVQKTVTVKEKQLVLTLSDEEAKTLNLILNRVGGDPNKSRRKYADSIHNAMGSYKYTSSSKDDDFIDKRNRAIYFVDEEGINDERNESTL